MPEMAVVFGCFPSKMKNLEGRECKYLQITFIQACVICSRERKHRSYQRFGGFIIISSLGKEKKERKKKVSWTRMGNGINEK